MSLRKSPQRVKDEKGGAAPMPLRSGHGEPLSFEEYHAQMNRARKQAEERATPKKTESKLRFQDVGSFLELYEVQTMVAWLVVLDLLCAVAEIVLSCREDTSLTPSPLATYRELGKLIVEQGLRAFSGFTIVFFTIECAMLVSSFGTRFWGHIGYVSDVAVLIIILTARLTLGNLEVRLLGICRLWRLLRLWNVTVEQLKAETRLVRQELEEQVHRTNVLEMEKREAENAVKREQKAKRGWDHMLQAYRDEIDTLNEALRIAAADVFEASATDEDLDHEETDLRKPGESKAKGVPDAPSVDEKTTRIIVHEDGQWSQVAPT